MAYRKHPVGLLLDTDPTEARRRIVEAFTRARCVLRDAADLLDTDRVTLRRWVVRLKLEVALKRATREAKRAGRFGSGRPKGRPLKKRGNETRVSSRSAGE